MTATHAPSPVWSGYAFVTAVWLAKSETPEWIAGRADALLAQLQGILGIARWDTARGDRWEGSPEVLAGIVRRNPVREALPDGEDGEPLSGEGYSMVLMGAGPSVEVRVWVSAGYVSFGGRVPAHHLKVDLREITPGGLTSEVGDAVVTAVASTWRPSYLMLTDREANRVARRGNWKIRVGYRTWINAQTAAVTQVADGLTMSKQNEGTLISAPDDWSAERVVEAMVATLQMNGLDEVPH
ncbi:hypothetical protein [Mycobacteroides abscessus]|uniref:hypothetical protein n=1 Tax=Mycobacteroides abscessus TaxID=36809 RepID=UPI001F1E2B4D|nr:hypothetical protein [Mycobacteroides abscessus]